MTSVAVAGLGHCDMRGLTIPAVEALEGWRRTWAAGCASRCLDAIIAACLLSPLVSPSDVGALPPASRASLRWAALSINDARTDYLRLRGTTLGLDERTLFALESAHRQRARRLFGVSRKDVNASMQVQRAPLDLYRRAHAGAEAAVYRAPVALTLGDAFQPGGALAGVGGFQEALKAMTAPRASSGLSGVAAALEDITSPLATSVTAGITKDVSFGLHPEIARVAGARIVFADRQRLVTGRTAEHLSSIMRQASLPALHSETSILSLGSTLRDALAPLTASALDSPVWRELDELWDRAKGGLFAWLLSHLDVRTLRAVLTGDPTMERAAVQALTDVHALAVLQQGVDQATFLADQNRRWLTDGLGRLIAGDDPDLPIPSLMTATEGAARDLARQRGLLTRNRGNDLIMLPNGKPKRASAMNQVSDLILVEDGHGQLVVQAYGRGNDFRHGMVHGASDPEIRRHLATVLLLLIGVLDQAGDNRPLEAVVLAVETWAHAHA